MAGLKRGDLISLPDAARSLGFTGAELKVQIRQGRFPSPITVRGRQFFLITMIDIWRDISPEHAIVGINEAAKYSRLSTKLLDRLILNRTLKRAGKVRGHTFCDLREVLAWKQANPHGPIAD